MTTQTNNQNNKEEFYLCSNLKNKEDNLKNGLKDKLDESTDFQSCIAFLHNLNEEYKFDVIPSVKEKYQNSPSKELVLALGHRVYNIYNEIYQEGLKKAESFGINPSEELPSKFPKSLEKLTFPENN